MVRDPRPPSVKWPVAQPLKQVVPSGRSLGRTPQSRKLEGRSSSKRATGHRTRRCTEPCVTVATAIAAFGSYDGPEVTMLREAMKKAQRTVPEPPISNQVKECEDFNARAEKRLVLHDQQMSNIIFGFGGRPKPTAEVARSLPRQLCRRRALASGPCRLGSSDPVPSTDGQPAAGGARCIDLCHRPESFQKTPKSRGACWGMSFLRDLGQSRPAPVRASGVSSRSNPGPATNSQCQAFAEHTVGL